VASVDCLDPRGGDGIATGGMEEADVLYQVGGVIGTIGTVLGIHNFIDKSPKLSL
jgi:hypothetical protein